jgi:putative aminopeptidase FrvX
MEDLFIDTGMGADEATKYLQVGDVISLDQNFKELNEGVITTRHFDDRGFEENRKMWG